MTEQLQDAKSFKTSKTLLCKLIIYSAEDKNANILFKVPVYVL